MARVLGFLGSARIDGYTVKVLNEAIEGAKTIPGVEVELIHLLDYQFGPCTSCYECIRMAEHLCILPDDMGKKGKGKLWRKVEEANGLILAAPVHCWTADALTHLFVERLYPMEWSGKLMGIPVITISVASNQGFQIVANTMLCQWAFSYAMKYVGGLPVHTAYLDDALLKARYQGIKIGEAALRDEKEGRNVPTDEEIWLYYQDKPWKVFPHYIENLTMGTRDPAFSIIKKSLAHGTFKRREAIELLKKADEEFDKFAFHYSLGNYENAIKLLVKTSAYWAHATYKEFLEEKLVKAPLPKIYRPILKK
ncbi:MAG: flavodoxin family protein [Candidatus Bathyarchaeota archaeon]|nr:MAG: flavodoxin family protein [Candidatus Bathyarchaeota archaeon]